jgi:hypothetical protein
VEGNTGSDRLHRIIRLNAFTHLSIPPSAPLIAEAVQGSVQLTPLPGPALELCGGPWVIDCKEPECLGLIGGFLCFVEWNAWEMREEGREGD